MRRLVFIGAVLICCFASAQECEKVETLCYKMVLKDSASYFVLSDKSCWKVVGFSKRWRSLAEWWEGVELAPEAYNSSPSDWYLGAQVEVYPKYGHMQVPEENASNQSIIKQCTHILVNSKTGHVLFGIALEAAECMSQLYEEGIGVGFEKGRQVGYKNANEIYNSGYTSGYEDGYRAGYRDAQEEGSP